METNIFTLCAIVWLFSSLIYACDPNGGPEGMTKCFPNKIRHTCVAEESVVSISNGTTEFPLNANLPLSNPFDKPKFRWIPSCILGPEVGNYSNCNDCEEIEEDTTTKIFSTVDYTSQSPSCSKPTDVVNCYWYSACVKHDRDCFLYEDELSFSENFCELYNTKSDVLINSTGRKWHNSVRTCFQSAIASLLYPTILKFVCENSMKDKILQVHRDCYSQTYAGTSICDIDEDFLGLTFWTMFESISSKTKTNKLAPLYQMVKSSDSCDKFTPFSSMVFIRQYQLEFDNKISRLSNRFNSYNRDDIVRIIRTHFVMLLNATMNGRYLVFVYPENTTQPSIFGVSNLSALIVIAPSTVVDYERDKNASQTKMKSVREQLSMMSKNGKMAIEEIGIELLRMDLCFKTKCVHFDFTATDQSEEGFNKDLLWFALVALVVLLGLLFLCIYRNGLGQFETNLELGNNLENPDEIMIPGLGIVIVDRKKQMKGNGDINDLKRENSEDSEDKVDVQGKF